MKLTLRGQQERLQDTALIALLVPETAVERSEIASIDRQYR